MNFFQKLAQQWRDNKPMSRDEEFALVQKNRQLEEALRELTEPKLLKMEATQEGGVAMDFEMGKALAMKMAEGLRACLEEVPGGPAENYVEFTLDDRKGGGYVLNLSRLGGKTPHQLRMAAEQELEKVRKERDELFLKALVYLR